MNFLYLKTILFSILWVYWIIGESDYRQGFDYNILNLHLSSTMFTYTLFMLIITYYILYMMTSLTWNYLLTMNIVATYMSMNVLLTGIFWSWSQWGTVQLYDIKIIIIGLLFVLFLTVSLLLLVSRKYIITIIFYNFYILYHIPLLKYNVVWNSEIHQKKTFYLIEFYIVNYNSMNIIMITTVLTIVILECVNLFYLTKKIISREHI